MKNKVMIEANIHQIKEGISQIKNLLYCMGKFIKEIEKGLDENNDENIDKIMFEDMCKKLEEENKKLKEYRSQRTRKIERENKKLREENKVLKGCLDKMMFDADVVNVKIHLESGDYCYVRSDKKFKLNVKD